MLRKGAELFALVDRVSSYFVFRICMDVYIVSISCLSNPYCVLQWLRFYIPAFLSMSTVLDVFSDVF